MTTAGDVLYSDDGHYWWDGSQWQPVQSEAPAEQLSPEEIFEGSFIQQLLGAEAEIGDYAVEELVQDPEMAALHSADPDEFRSMVQAIVEGALRD